MPSTAPSSTRSCISRPRLKRELKAGHRQPLLAGKTLAMIFEKPSLRTRVTFEVGMTQLGGYAVYLTPTDIRLGERESVADIARNLERWVDFIMARTFSHADARRARRHRAGAGDQRPLRSAPSLPGAERRASPCSNTAGDSTACASPGSVTATTSPTRGSRRRGASASRFALACPQGFEPDAALVAAARRGRRRRRRHQRRRRSRRRRRCPLHRRVDQHGPGGRGRRAPARPSPPTRSTLASSATPSPTRS